MSGKWCFKSVFGCIFIYSTVLNHSVGCNILLRRYIWDIALVTRQNTLQFASVVYHPQMRFVRGPVAKICQIWMNLTASFLQELLQVRRTQIYWRCLHYAFVDPIDIFSFVSIRSVVFITIFRILLFQLWQKYRGGLEDTRLSNTWLTCKNIPQMQKEQSTEEPVYPRLMARRQRVAIDDKTVLKLSHLGALWPRLGIGGNASKCFTRQLIGSCWI